VPEDSLAFCNFQIERLLKRNRVNEQLDMLKKEALGQALRENKPKDSSGGSVLLTVMEGLTRGHFLTRDDDDVMVRNLTFAGFKITTPRLPFPFIILCFSQTR
ncbi:hypothetical protein Tcan_02159, partial [Toxocara canis]